MSQMHQRQKHPDDTSPVPWDELRGQRILMTGGTGFFGCNLLHAYTQAWDRGGLGGSVTVLTRDATCFRAKAPNLAGHPGVEILEGDLTKGDLPNASWDYLIHAARQYGPPLDFLQGTLRTTERVLELAHGCGCRRVLYASSGAIYGPQPAEIKRIEEDYLGAPLLASESAYGEAKRASELLGLLFGGRYGFDFLIARGFAFVGPWLPLDSFSAAGNFIGDALAGRPIKVNGDGCPIRSYLHGEDLAEWLWTILLRGEHGRPYNVGSDQPISIRDLAMRIRDLLAPGQDVCIGRNAGWGPAHRYVPSVDRAHRELGLTAKVSLDEAILKTASWHREQTAPQ